MKFPSYNFALNTCIKSGSPSQHTEITVAAGDVPDEVVIAALTSGQSPRVALQSRMREDGIPKTLTLTWAQLLAPVKRTRVVTVPSTPSDIKARMLVDLEYRKEILKQMGLPEDTEILA